MKQNFIRTLTALIKIQNDIMDRFFLDKFKERVNNFSEDVIAVLGDKNIAQYYYWKIKSDIDNVFRDLEMFQYLKFLKKSPLLLQAMKELLQLKLEVVKIIISKSKLNIPIKKFGLQKTEAANRKSTKIDISNMELNDSKKKILEFIKIYPNKRTKDIIDEFSVLSIRTVKRNLTELLQAGLVKKRTDSKASYYS